jgi:hypothetical protein
MQKDFDQEGLPIVIIGINQEGYEIGNPTITEGRDIPWLQDTTFNPFMSYQSKIPEETDAWTLWDVTYRDVQILDSDGNLRFIYNLSEHDLNQNSSYNELRSIMTGLIE